MLKRTYRIRENETGNVRNYTRDLDPKFIDSEIYLWEEGNYGCDCNRALHFAWANGDDDAPDRQCGNSAYSVQILDENDKVIHDEF